MREVFAALERHVVLLAVELVERLQVGEALRRHLFGPIVGGVHALRLRREEGRDLDVAGVHAEQGGVLAGAAALHGRADHHHRVGQGETRVGCREEHRLRAAAAGAGHRQAGRVDLGQRQQEVHAADRVQGLEAHHVLEVGLGLRAVESPAIGSVHLRPLLGELMDDLRRELLRIGVAERVNLPDHAAHAGELDTHRLEAGLAALFEALLAGRDFLADVFVGLDQEARVGPVSVREDHRRHLARDVLGSVEITRHEEARRAFEVHLLDRVFALVDLAVNDRVERRLGRHRPEALGDQQLPADEITARLPFLDGLRGGEGEVAVEVLERTKARVFGVGEVQQAEGREGERGEAHKGNMSLLSDDGK